MMPVPDSMSALESEDVVRFKSYCCECELMIEALKSNPFFAKQLR